MSTEQERLRQMAERVARRVSQNGQADEASPRQSESAGNMGSELAAVRASLAELQQRLVQIESHVTRKNDYSAHTSRADVQSEAQRAEPSSASQWASRSPWLSGMYVPAAAHPSQERFGIEEATVSELVDFFEGEKKCELEPGGKPCDHCAMCSSRGF